MPQSLLYKLTGGADPKKLIPLGGFGFFASLAFDRAAWLPVTWRWKAISLAAGTLTTLTACDNPLSMLIFASPAVYLSGQRLLESGGANLFLAVSIFAETMSNIFPLFGPKRKTQTQNTEDIFKKFATMGYFILCWRLVPQADKVWLITCKLLQDRRKIWIWLIGRRVCSTKKGRIGIFPPFAQRGDQICAFFGAPNPFVLRPVEGYLETVGECRYRLLGVCYVEGVMAGELKEQELQAEMIHLI